MFVLLLYVIQWSVNISYNDIPANNVDRNVCSGFIIIICTRLCSTFDVRIEEQARS